MLFLGGVLIVNDVEHGDKEGGVVVGVKASDGLHGCFLVVGELMVERCYLVDLEASLRGNILVKLFICIPDFHDDSCNVPDMVELEFVPVVVK